MSASRKSTWILLLLVSHLQLAAQPTATPGAAGQSGRSGSLSPPNGVPAASAARMPGQPDPRDYVLRLPPQFQFPPMPHEVRPNTWPQPEYFAEALARTERVPRPEVQALELRSINELRKPATLVLPVQSQAFGFSRAFRALAGALLDMELAARNIVASRQTDIVSVAGPYVRRFGDKELEAFTRERGGSRVIELYLGHSGSGKGFVTIIKRTSHDSVGRERAHRSFDLPPNARDAIDTLASTLPALLDELGVKAKASPTSARGAPTCSADVWKLERLDAAASSSTRACHALAIGSLLPTFESGPIFGANDSPAKLAWLATAWTEASGSAQASMTAIASLAWLQLGLEDPKDAALAHIGIRDPVVAPIARLLSARASSQTRPVASVRDATESAIQSASKELPPLARAAFIERGMQPEGFREVDLCAIEREVPGMMLRRSCVAERGGTRTATPGRASDLARAVYEEWRLAYYRKGIVYRGMTLGQEQALQKWLASMPDDVSEHPFIARARYAAQTSSALEGSEREQKERMLAMVGPFVQSTVDAQFYGETLAQYSLSEHASSANTRVSGDPRITSMIDDERRLVEVLRADAFASATNRYRVRGVGEGAAFLVKGPITDALRQAEMARFTAQVAAQRSSMPVLQTPPNSPPLEMRFDSNRRTVEQWREQVARAPKYLPIRIRLAMAMLARGESPESAVRIIEERPVDQRRDEQIGESHDWNDVANAFYFAGDIANARRYLQRVRLIGTGSSSDMMAAERLSMIDGDVEAAIAAAERRLRRYDDDFVRRDRASLHFMRAQSDEGWALLRPRLFNASSFELWHGAFVGHRIAGVDVTAASAWLDQHQLRGAQVNGSDIAVPYLHLLATTDHVPTHAEIASLRSTGAIQYAASAELVRMAMLDRYPTETLDAVRKTNPESEDSSFMRPLYAWAAWHAARASDPILPLFDQVRLETAGFDELLSKAAIVGLDGKHDESLRLLRAARWQLSELGLRSRSAAMERRIPSPYQYALSIYLLWRKTGHEAYRGEALDFVKAYQLVKPFFGWAYALQAVLDSDPGARSRAICRARHLDPASHFLSLVRDAPVGAACVQPLW